MEVSDPPSKTRLYWDAFKASLTQIAENDVSLISAGVAFFAMLSLFPALAALIAVLGMISDAAVVLPQLEKMRGFLPNDVYEIISVQVTSLITARTETLGWAGVLSLFFALWSARAGVGAMMIGLNKVYKQRNRNTAWHYLRALMLTVMLVLVGIVALLTLVVAPVLLAFFPLGPFGTLAVEVLRWVIAIVVLFAGVGVLYRFGPNRKAARLPWLSPGAVLAVLLWAILSVGFSYYVANFGNYNQVYGSIGAVIAMLIWLWISSFLVLFGASLNAQIELRTASDTTVGRPRPMGQRGAVVADEMVEVPESS
ncbi:ribonuclease BN [Sulfitobacter alexandrii]|uniref:Ribonuclease BN n=1 Tax=Sulfitobacter alexandrii TaxID=1917485 RepID=A0A1J0WCT5_9RHOB|nr:YihY/virulence factor BrkB family protein [Sulfitobacter alexandrii]APE41982.1 ribonuclease BN [Sulfitobacter alexandrii]